MRTPGTADWAGAGDTWRHVTCSRHVDLLHPRIYLHVAPAARPPRAALVVGAVGGHAAVVAGGVVGAGRGAGAGGDLAGAGVAGHVRGGGEGRRLGAGGGRGHGRPAAVAGELAGRVAAVRHRVRN